MRSFPLNDTFEKVAKRVIWFEPPEQSLRDPVRFVAYAMSYATFEDMQRIREHVTDDELREVLASAPPGIIDPRSWAYWHVVLGQYPAPPMPARELNRESAR